MLILTRRVGEKLIIGDNIVVANLGVNGNQVRFGVEAPKDVQILRDNAICRNKKENKDKKMIEYTRKSDGEVYCILSVTDYDLATHLIGKRVSYSNSFAKLLAELDGPITFVGELVRVHIAFLIDDVAKEFNFIACKKSDLKLPEEKPVNNGWYSYLDADKPEVQVLIGKEVEYSDKPLYDNLKVGLLEKIQEISCYGRYDIKGNGPFHFVRPIKQKPLKPVDDNCLFKPVLVKNKHNIWLKAIFVGSTKNNFYVLTNKLTSPEQYGHSQIAKVKPFEVKRCFYIEYGDEDE